MSKIHPTGGSNSDWLFDNDQLSRPSISKDAMNSFADIISEQISNGEASLEDFGIKSNDSNALSSCDGDCGCDMDSLSEIDESAKRLKDAESAYNELHGIKKKAKTQPSKGAHSILPSRGYKADQTEYSANKQLGSDTNNSILDPDKIERASRKKKESKYDERARRREVARRNEISLKNAHLINAEEVQDSLNGNDNKSVRSLWTETGGEYEKQLPHKGLSIFDEGDPFERISKYTEGERAAMESKKEKEARSKDRSWTAKGSGTTSTDGIFRSMIDSFTKGK